MHVAAAALALVLLAVPQGEALAWAPRLPPKLVAAVASPAARERSLAERAAATPRVDFAPPAIDRNESAATATLPCTLTKGDVNGDGFATNSDLIMLSEYLRGWATFNACQLEAIDTNCSGAVTNADYFVLILYVNGELTEFCS